MSTAEVNTSEKVQEAQLSQAAQDNGNNGQSHQIPIKEVKDTTITFGERHGRINRWIPKRWEEYYNQIVILRALNLKSNTELAEYFKVTPQHVSNILNTPQAEELRERIFNTALDNTKRVSIEGLINKALERVSAVLDNDEIFEKKTEFVTNLAMRMISHKMEKQEGSGNINVHGGQAIIFSAADGAAMREALKKSREADELNASRPVESPLRLLKDGTTSR